MTNHDVNTRKKISFVYIIAVVCVFSLIAYLIATPKIKKTSTETITYGRILLGTIVDITLWEDNTEAVEAAYSEISRLEQLFSSYIETSDVSRIGNTAGGAGVEVSPEVIYVLERAYMASRLSDGAFDPTVGAVTQLWDFSGSDEEATVVPTKAEIKKLLPLVDYRAIIIDKERSVAGLKKKNSRMILGGIAKGYIVGRAVEKLKAHGVRRAIIRAGGDMTFFKLKNEKISESDQKKFTIGIQHPRNREKLLGKLSIEGSEAGTAVATSGDYERFFIKNGVRYHHIIDPKTGYPATKCRSVTIVSLDPTIADALSTAVFVMGPQGGMELIKTLPGVEAIIVDKNGEITMTEGMKKQFSLERKTL